MAQSDDEIFQNLFGASQQARPVSQLPQFPQPPVAPLKYFITGVDNDTEKHVRGLLDVMQPGNYPDIAAMPRGQYSMFLNNLRRGANTSINHADGWTNAGSCITIPGVSRIWCADDVFNNDDKLVRNLSHEIGHKLAKNNTEEEAERMAKPMRERYKQSLTPKK